MPPLKPGKIITGKGKIATEAPKKVDPETAKETRRLPPKKVDPETARETRRIAPKPPKFVGFDPSSTLPKPKKAVSVTPVSSSSGSGSGGGGGGGTTSPPGVTPGPVIKNPAEPSPIEVLDPNVYTIYKEEIKRLTLRLVNRAKNLLLAYDFSSIDKITDYQIETDRAARNSNIITTPQVPESRSSSSLTAQDTAVSLINAISNQISDNVPLATKLALFGSDVNGTFTAGKLGISNGIANYDLRFKVDNVSPEIKKIIVRCYEIG
jgi:hypothetical protein